MAGGDLLGRLWPTELPHASGQRIPWRWLEPHWRGALPVLPEVCRLCERWVLNVLCLSDLGWHSHGYIQGKEDPLHCFVFIKRIDSTGRWQLVEKSQKIRSDKDQENHRMILFSRSTKFQCQIQEETHTVGLSALCATSITERGGLLTSSYLFHRVKCKVDSRFLDYGMDGWMHGWWVNELMEIKNNWIVIWDH